MNNPFPGFAHRTAVEVYGAFLDECVIARVGEDRAGAPARASASKIDGRPVRLVTISGKGGASEDPALTERWTQHDNISLLDHLLSVARGALMFWLSDVPRSWASETDLAEIERLAHGVVCVAFLHDIDKDLGLRRGRTIAVGAVAERMARYGIDKFLVDHGLLISPAAMVNYIEEVEGTQAARSPAAPDYDRRIAAVCRYVELADKLEGTFTSGATGAGVEGVITTLGDPNRWPVLQDGGLRHWEKVEIHDHLHVFLLDRFQRALSTACKDVAGRLPLIEIVHDGRLLCVIPQKQAGRIKETALDDFLNALPDHLRFSVNNRLACEFVGGAASWHACAYQKPHTHGLRDRSRGPGPASDRQPKQGRRALSGSRRSVGVLRTFLRPPRQRARSSGAGHPWLRSGRLSMVAVVQAAHVRPRDDLARGRRLNGPTHRRILA